MKPITLTGLTEEQVDMLDHLWSMESQEQVEAWLTHLTPRQQSICRSLQMLVVLEALEQIMEDDVCVVEDAQSVLNRFRLH